jgi:uncharacterized protein YcfL
MKKLVLFFFATFLFVGCQSTVFLTRKAKDTLINECLPAKE